LRVPTQVTINPSVIFRELAGEVVLLNLQSGVYYGLDSVGSRIWHLLANRQSIDEVCAVLLDEFEVSPEVLRADVTRIVEELAEKGLIAIPPSASPS
jgi:Coenzyme PQQ synthesis protein D (PqqD)